MGAQRLRAACAWAAGTSERPGIAPRNPIPETRILNASCLCRSIPGSLQQVVRRRCTGTKAASIPAGAYIFRTGERSFLILHDNRCLA